MQVRLRAAPNSRSSTVLAKRALDFSGSLVWPQGPRWGRLGRGAANGQLEHHKRRQNAGQCRRHGAQQRKPCKWQGAKALSPRWRYRGYRGYRILLWASGPSAFIPNSRNPSSAGRPLFLSDSVTFAATAGFRSNAPARTQSPARNGDGGRRNLLPRRQRSLRRSATTAIAKPRRGLDPNHHLPARPPCPAHRSRQASHRLCR
jgi:hypothetical protein